MDASPPPRTANQDAISAATQRYLGALTVLTDEDVREPSLLPRWTRGHVITHLARNADALVGVLVGVRQGVVPTMYRSAEERDAEIETGAHRCAADLLFDATDSEQRWIEAVAAHAPALDARPFSRVPGSAQLPAEDVFTMRRVEVEVHHADLGIGYTAADWPEDFTAAILRRRHDELASSGHRLSVRAIDNDVAWSTGPGPEVTGTAADLAWWLLGRGRGEALASSDGQLPDIGPWR